MQIPIGLACFAWFALLLTVKDAKAQEDADKAQTDQPDIAPITQANKTPSGNVKQDVIMGRHKLTSKKRSKLVITPKAIYAANAYGPVYALPGPPSDCVASNGLRYRDGSRWLERSFLVECYGLGYISVIKVVACLDSNAYPRMVGDIWNEGNHWYICQVYRNQRGQEEVKHVALATKPAVQQSTIYTSPVPLTVDPIGVSLPAGSRVTLSKPATSPPIIQVVAAPDSAAAIKPPQPPPQVVFVKPPAATAPPPPLSAAKPKQPTIIVVSPQTPEEPVEAEDSSMDATFPTPIGGLSRLYSNVPTSDVIVDGSINRSR